MSFQILVIRLLFIIAKGQGYNMPAVVALEMEAERCGLN